MWAFIQQFLKNPKRLFCKKVPIIEVIKPECNREPGCIECMNILQNDKFVVRELIPFWIGHSWIFWGIEPYKKEVVCNLLNSSYIWGGVNDCVSNWSLHYNQKSAMFDSGLLIVQKNS